MTCLSRQTFKLEYLLSQGLSLNHCGSTLVVNRVACLSVGPGLTPDLVALMNRIGANE
jgi:hypothetical protein